ncbi:hypothetical protein DL95DRAFT_454660 [Leptodontidium sp. 2 PMI_412]|nr:hypothetical protein DL95DRAFT_454660 [Leptodontidium sp. 2 PMI_412]
MIVTPIISFYLPPVPTTVASDPGAIPVQVEELQIQEASGFRRPEPDTTPRQSLLSLSFARFCLGADRAPSWDRLVYKALDSAFLLNLLLLGIFTVLVPVYSYRDQCFQSCYDKSTWTYAVSVVFFYALLLFSIQRNGDNGPLGWTILTSFTTLFIKQLSRSAGRGFPEDPTLRDWRVESGSADSRQSSNVELQNQSSVADDGNEIQPTTSAPTLGVSRRSTYPLPQDDEIRPESVLPPSAVAQAHLRH